ncbi:VOC family protein [Ruegeria arenilitoris]|uniref:VOC family protein n=1 Tax=Ruegeria arenilitoris TaxID=1173585 RepID=UPI00147EAD17|nr:hypothetical protein [Ruegeria arenilitoris]
MQQTFGWVPDDIGKMTFLTLNGQDKPFAAITDEMESVSGWVPFLEVDGLPVAVFDAKNRGASIIAEDLQGPAGVATFILDPGGATIALWKRASGA